jgi:hypothetical protein
MNLSHESQPVFGKGELATFLENNHFVRFNMPDEVLVAVKDWYSDLPGSVDPVIISAEIFRYNEERKILLLHMDTDWYPENFGETALYLHSAVNGLRCAANDLSLHKHTKIFRDITHIVGASHKPLVDILRKVVSSFTVVDYLPPEGRFVSDILDEADLAGTPVTRSRSKYSYPIAVSPVDQFIRQLR